MGLEKIIKKAIVVMGMALSVWSFKLDEYPNSFQVCANPILNCENNFKTQALDEPQNSNVQAPKEQPNSELETTSQKTLKRLQIRWHSIKQAPKRWHKQNCNNNR